MKKSLNIIPITILAIFVFTACEKKGDPPSLPPAESMQIDFSEFIAGTKSANIAAESKGAFSVNNTNWTVAASVAGVWNSILLLNLGVPVESFRLAVKNKPEYLDNKTWQWKYTAPVVGATYTARLTGQIRSTDVKWEMYITRDGAGGFAEFKWFEGTTKLDGKSGQWILVQGQDQQVPMVQIDWTKEGSSVGSVQYTYIKEDGPLKKGNYIQYGLTTNPLDAYYTVEFWESNRQLTVLVNIEWSTTIHNGRIKAANYFLDSNWHCWDAGGVDTTCPN